MNTTNRNAWTAPTGHDTLLNGALLAAGMLGLLFALLQGPDTSATQVAHAEVASAKVAAQG